MTTTIYIHKVLKKEILAGDITRLSKKIKNLEKEGKKSKGGLIILFDGYNYDPREIYQIPQIRNFVRKLYEKHPYFIYFMNDADNNDYLLLACLGKLNNVSRNISGLICPDITLSDEIKKKIITAVIMNCYYDGESQESLEEKLEVLRYI